MARVTTDMQVARNSVTSATDLMRGPGASFQQALFDAADLFRNPSQAAKQSEALGFGTCDPEAAARTAARFTGPQEVLGHPALAGSAKRALLASWASDACAVECLPNWRKLAETDNLVPLDEILDALQALDRAALN